MCVAGGTLCNHCEKKELRQWAIGKAAHSCKLIAKAERTAMKERQGMRG